MAVKGLTALTLADWGKRVDPNGKVDKIIELSVKLTRSFRICPLSKGTFLPDTEPPFVLVYLQLPAFAELWRTAKQINHSAGNRFRWHAGNLC